MELGRPKPPEESRKVEGLPRVQEDPVHTLEPVEDEGILTLPQRHGYPPQEEIEGSSREGESHRPEGLFPLPTGQDRLGPEAPPPGELLGSQEAEEGLVTGNREGWIVGPPQGGLPVVGLSLPSPLLPQPGRPPVQEVPQCGIVFCQTPPPRARDLRQLGCHGVSPDHGEGGSRKAQGVEGLPQLVTPMVRGEGPTVLGGQGMRKGQAEGQEKSQRQGNPALCPHGSDGLPNRFNRTRASSRGCW